MMFNCMILNQLLRNYLQSQKVFNLEKLLKPKFEKNFKKENLEEIDQPLIQKSKKDPSATQKQGHEENSNIHHFKI